MLVLPTWLHRCKWIHSFTVFLSSFFYSLHYYYYCLSATIHVKNKNRTFHQILIQVVFKVTMLKVILSLIWHNAFVYMMENQNIAWKKSTSAPVELAFIFMFVLNGSGSIGIAITECKWGSGAKLYFATTVCCWKSRCKFDRVVF